MKHLLPLLILLTSCTIEHVVEPRTIIPCSHNIYRTPGKVHFEIESKEPFVDICISTSRLDVRCFNVQAVYYGCISKTVPDQEITVEVYSGKDYCCEVR